MRIASQLCISIFLSLIFCNSHAETPDAESAVSLTFVGDIMLDDTPGKMIKKGLDPFSHVASMLNESDIRIGNLECVISTKGHAEADKPYTFRAHPRTLKFLKRHFDVLALANNHSGDYGPDAFAEMLKLLEGYGIPYFGGGNNLFMAHRPLLLERKGLRIALLGYNEFFPRSFEADFDKPGIAWSEDEQVLLDITNARRQYHADIVIPFMHWGIEHEPHASYRQQQLARLMIEAGADAVVGGHPHVTQNIEYIHGKPVIYSLGNFVFDGFTDADNNTGWILKLVVGRQGVGAFQINSVKIDAQGFPHPGVPQHSMCWKKGQEKELGCVQ